MIGRAGPRLTAVLGPTNTGKTYLAVERMLGHESGMIGFPLRLLARENYDRIRKSKGDRAVALVTGEEKILPASARYFVCTVESMPLDRPVAFLAIDEVQMAADPERGHVFTDRLLHARGLQETMLLGADTMRPLLRRLLPGLELVTRPRFSTLSYSGPRKPTRLPPRSAVVAFSAAEVYRIAEMMRRQRGGTAVVMGALSPRTRNAQVEMYQAGEVDHLVATDAIGMGLNMDLVHVAFAGLSKFDGRAPRRLSAAELAQIAGRAGRHMNDGSFGTTAEVGGLQPEIVEAIENHRFDAVPALMWRNSDLDFRSLAALRQSLERPSPDPALRRAREAEDQLALAQLALDPDILQRLTGRARLKLFWDVCQIPDFRKVMSDAHARLLGQVFRHLTSAAARLPNDWVAGQVARLDSAEGDIDTLMARIAHIRTWTYIAHRADWLADPAEWQERTRAVEDKLSDALHRSSTQRFVDRRQALLLRRMKGGGALSGVVTRAGEVIVEGHSVGQLSGFRFVPDGSGGAEESRPLLAAARRALTQEIPARLARLEKAGEASFALSQAGIISWEGAPVARLIAGDTVLGSPGRSAAERSHRGRRARALAPAPGALAGRAYREAPRPLERGDGRAGGGRDPRRAVPADRGLGPAAPARAGSATAALGYQGAFPARRPSRPGDGLVPGPGAGGQPHWTSLVHQGGPGAGPAADPPAGEPGPRPRPAGRVLSRRRLSPGRASGGAGRCLGAAFPCRLAPGRAGTFPGGGGAAPDDPVRCRGLAGGDRGAWAIARPRKMASCASTFRPRRRARPGAGAAGRDRPRPIRPSRR